VPAIPKAATITTRRYDIDWLRTAAVFMLIPYHSSRIFDVWESFYVKNAQTSLAMTGIRAFLDPWGMPLLFVIAGEASWLALRRRSGAQYVHERVLRLVIPLLFGLAVIVPPQAYIAWLGQGYTGSYWHFFRQYWVVRSEDLSGFTGGFTLGHLWFVLFLFVFSMVALPLFLYLKGSSGSHAVGWLAGLCQRPGTVFLYVIPLWLTEALPGPSVGGVTPLAFILLFVAGFVLLADARYQAALDRSWRWALGLGTITLAAVVAVRFSGIQFVEYSWQSTLFDLLRYFTTWAWIIGLLGFGHRHLNRTHPVLPYLSMVAYPLYILHQTVIVLLGFYIVRWSVGIFPKFLIIAVTATGITLGLCELCRRWNATRSLMGMKPPARPASDQVVADAEPRVTVDSVVEQE
jgi:glucan biosynthesis protein C